MGDLDTGRKIGDKKDALAHVPDLNDALTGGLAEGPVVEKPSGLKRLVQYFVDKVSAVRPDDKEEREKMRGLKDGVQKDLGEMVQSDTNIYTILVNALEKTGASSAEWQLLRDYLNKGLEVAKTEKYSLPPRMSYRSFAMIKDLFEKAQDARFIKTFLEILLRSDEQEMTFIARWQPYHENDLENIWELHESINRLKARNSKGYDYLLAIEVDNFAQNFDELVLYLEYLTEAPKISSSGALNYIATHKYRQGPYR